MIDQTLTYRTMEAMIRTARLHRALCDRETAVIGIHRSQNRMLACLSRFGALSQNALALKMQITPAVVTVTVQKLLDAGYVERLENPADHRAYLISITPEGQEVVDKTGVILDTVDQGVLEGFTDEDKNTLMALCQRMLDNMEHMGMKEEKA